MAADEWLATADRSLELGGRTFHIRHVGPALDVGAGFLSGVLNTSLVYEYSGPDAPASATGEVSDYRAWRGSLKGSTGPARPPA